MSEKEQKAKQEEILQRLKAVNFLDKETLEDVVNALKEEEGWSLAKVLAHLDMIDYDERS